MTSRSRQAAYSTDKTLSRKPGAIQPRLISTQTKMLEDFRCLAWCCCILYEKQNVFSYFLTFFIPAIS